MDIDSKQDELIRSRNIHGLRKLIKLGEREHHQQAGLCIRRLLYDDGLYVRRQEKNQRLAEYLRW